MPPRPPETAIRERWFALWQHLGAPVVPAAIYDELLAAYAQKHRAYHGLEHLEDCLQTFDAHASLARAPEAVELALWFHDAVYETRRSDNEAASARWAEGVIHQAQLGGTLASTVEEHILATCHNATPESPDGRLMVDIDLAILGRPAERFDRYERDVRREYHWVPTVLYRRKRAEVLRTFLKRPRIYLTEPFYQGFEKAARANIARSLERL